MGTFVFKWPYPNAKVVFVTGSFDDWAKSEKLDKVGDTFEKEVHLPDATQKISYKFVVDGDWTIDRTAPQEVDGHSNVNNILLPENIKKTNSQTSQGAAAGGIGAALFSSVHPDSTTAQLAGQVPKETDKLAAAAANEHPSDSTPALGRATSPPGAFPETPAQEIPSFSVNPIPASEGASNPVSIPAGEKLPEHHGITGNTIGSNVSTSKEDYEKDASSALPEDKSYSVDPIPASAGIGNPISLPAGEPVKKHKNFLPESIYANATTSKEDYEKAGSAALPVGAAVDSVDDAKDPAFTLPEKSENLIPESSLPIGGEGKDAAEPSPFIQSSGAGTTTAALAGQVPLQPKAEKDHPGANPFIQSTGPGATTAALAGQVPLQPKAEKDHPDANPFIQSTGPDATTAALAGQVPLQSEAEKEQSDVNPFIQSTGPDATTAALAGQVPLQSKAEKEQSDVNPFIQSTGPDATTAALAGQVPLQSKTEKEHSDVNPFIQSTGPGATTAALAGQVPLEPKPGKDVPDADPFIRSSGPDTTTAALAGRVPLESKSKPTVIDDEPPSATVTGPAPDVPEVVKESLSKAHEPPEAAASPEAVEEKKKVENELLQEVKPTDAAYAPAPTIAASTSATAPSATPADSKAAEVSKAPFEASQQDREPSRDISPEGRDSNTTPPAPPSPQVTTGVGESTTSTTSTPKKTGTSVGSATSSPAISNGAKDKKAKRRSFFGKLKDKLKP